MTFHSRLSNNLFPRWKSQQNGDAFMRTGLAINYALSQNVKKLSHTITLVTFKAVLPSNPLFQRINSNSILRFLVFPSSVALGGHGSVIFLDTHWLTPVGLKF